MGVYSVVSSWVLGPKGLGLLDVRAPLLRNKGPGIFDVCMDPGFLDVRPGVLRHKGLRFLDVRAQGSYM